MKILSKACLVAATLFAMPGVQLYAQDRQSQANDCEVGIYRKDGTGFVVITKRENTFRYSFDNGEVGKIGTPDARVACMSGAVQVNRSDIWKKVPLVQTDTLINAGSVLLAGRLIEPLDASKQTPLVVFAHGSEPLGWIDRVRYPYMLAARGISVFVYDKRGTGLSQGKYSQNFPQLADDLVAAASEARRLAVGRFGRFGLIGVSQGGWIAPMAANRAKADFLGIGYGLAINMKEEDAAQVQKELRDVGYGDDVLRKAKRITDATAKVASTGYREGLGQLAEVQRLYGEEPWFEKVKGGYTGVLLSKSVDDLRENGIPQYDGLNVDWSHDPMAILRQVKIPQLWVLAEEDREAPVAETLDRLRELRENGQEVNIFMFPDTDHGMWEFEQDDNGSRQLTKIADGYFRLLADWAEDMLNDPYGRARIVR
ncbi:hypothetical protein GCM10009096_05710 [Parasphingorhabdus litoris]|uniref:AB hydrolase-1 domain-containing protein n=1 Tax=Parasphingorhabdus litoris TaxID=394733 RepID=A0ABN1A522_9SPHN|nr:alpha/beta hydrolase [Parasphingorhabdus litoris]